MLSHVLTISCSDCSLMCGSCEAGFAYLNCLDACLQPGVSARVEEYMRMG